MSNLLAQESASHRNKDNQVIAQLKLSIMATNTDTNMDTLDEAVNGDDQVFKTERMDLKQLLQ
jgi:hypothetical protein